MSVPIRLITAVSLVMAIGGCQSNQQVEDRLVLAFGEAMFNTGRISDTAEEGARAAVTARFSSPVRVGVFEGATADNQEFTRRTLEEFAIVTGVKIDWRPPEDRDADLVILFTDEKEFVVNGNQRGICYASVHADDKGVIRFAAVHVSWKSENVWRNECLVHELLHAFGWRGHTHRIRSANSYMHDEHELTRWDRLLLRTLYDPRLPPGTPKEDAIPKARVILRGLLADE